MKLRTKFQDEDFELGEVVEGVIVECLGKHEEKLRVIATAAKGGQSTFYYSSIKKFMDDWEDAPEEPKEYWYIYADKPHRAVCGDILGEDFKSIGNYFKTKEEAEKAVEKLKALTEAKKDGLEIKGYYYNHEDLVILADIGKCNKLTLDTLFGKEID